MPAVNHANFPAALKSLKQWVNWKGDKVPRSPEGRPISSTDPAQWVDLDSAMSAYALSGMDGVGFVFSSGVVGIDMDDCLDGDTLKPWGLKVLSALPEGAYVEYSPSGRGLHALVAGHKPGPQCRKVLQNKGGARLGEIEMYDSGRYFTMTGNLWNGCSGDLVDGQAAVNALYAKLFPSDINKAPEVSTPAPSKENTHELNADDIIALIESSAQGPKFKALMAGPLESALSAYEGDHSRAVHALCAVVAWWTGSPAAMEAIAGRSCLLTGKWAPDPTAGGRAAKGKWAVLGLPGFRKLRAQYLAAGDFYEPGQGRVAPAQDFGHTDDSPGSGGKKDGGYQRHIDLAKEKGELRKDLLSGVLHCRTASGWEPVFTKSFVGALRGDCKARGKPYKAQNLEDFLCRFERDARGELLLDLPTWDGQDRIGEMCHKVHIENVSGEVFEDLFKDWCSRLWRKIFSPDTVENRCILLSGKQGTGKDIWIRSVLFAFGKYFANLVLSNKFSAERDISIAMGSSIALVISEFDKTEQLGPAVLKDLISKNSFTSVRKYDREATTQSNCCSIIAACNPENILRDVTGNRRFLIFRLAGGPGQAIDWSYPYVDKAFSLQCIAQIKRLGELLYKSSGVSEQIMADIQAEHTPEDPNTEAVFDFESAITGRAAADSLSPNPGLYRLDQISDILDGICRNYDIKRRQLLCVLKAAGCQKRTANCRWYGTRAAVRADIPEVKDSWEDSFN